MARNAPNRRFRPRWGLSPHPEMEPFWNYQTVSLRTLMNKGPGAEIRAPGNTPNVFLILGSGGRGSALRRPHLIGRHLVYAVLHQGV